ncbi:MAG: hypothetical protein M1833_004323 [Piccolia ochrophora]|nr:MAG: hypothetical protein M1833_004323 [Piccolia ochrophora]
MESNASKPAHPRSHALNLSSPPPSASSNSSKRPSQESDRQHHHHHHHHPHLPHTHHHQHHRSHRDRFLPQSAIQLRQTTSPTDFLPKSTTWNLAEAKNASAPAIAEKSSAPSVTAASAPSPKKPSRTITDADVQRAKDLSRLRADALRDHLNSLTDSTHTITRRLDVTYYSLLERSTTLHSTIASLSDLCSHTSHLTSTFTSSVDELSSDTKGQVSGITESLGTQAANIEKLEARVRVGREKVDALAERVKGVREKVEKWEGREAEWTARIRRRLRFLWATSLTLFSLFVILLVIHYLPSSPRSSLSHQLPHHRLNTSTKELRGLFDDLEERARKKREDTNVLEGMKGAGEQRFRGGVLVTEDDGEEKVDERLRVFDEL